jgi:medium-chain acyl-[acyl-carrier-protein] hydrolase
MYTIERTVSASNVGSDGLLTFDSAFDFMIDCSSFWMNSEPEFLSFLERKKLGMFLVSRQAEIIRLPAYGENINVTTSIYSCKRFCGFRNTIIRDEQGEDCVVSYSVGAFVDFQTGKPAKLSDKVKLTFDPQYENIEYLPRKIERHTAIPLCCETSVVKKTQIDRYKHMNSTKYVILALDIMPINFMYNRIRIEYKSQAKLGDVLYTKLYQESDSKYIVTIATGEDIPNAIIEFSIKH